MQFPESWLRKFCNPPITTQQLADTLTMAGLEVEEMQTVAPFFSHVVVGEILSVEQHPDADRLRVCQVHIGKEKALSIVCGAPNARAGIKVPCALVGAELPPGEDGKPFHIKLGKLRGVESQGMLCSARELKISDDSQGLLELATDAVAGVNIREHLNLDDTLFTLKLTPNLAHCLSVFGVARELSALTGSPLLQPVFAPVTPNVKDVLPVNVLSKDLCGRFSGRIIRGLNTQVKTPEWMVQRLARCGQRSVSPLVDISNYVMFEFGRPTHIFDLQKIHGGLTVRWGQSGETLELLNGQTVTLDDKVGVIADEQQVESMAGIMGGAATAVSDATTDIYVEAAFWWPTAIAGRSRRFNFATDAGHRFERGVDPATTVDHIEHITSLILSICATPTTHIGPIDDHVSHTASAQAVSMRLARANKVLGTHLSQQAMSDALKGLGLQVKESDGLIEVTPPSFRFDLKIEEDLIEEVARMVGFDSLPSTPPSAPITAKLQPENRRPVFAVRRHLAALGYQETINFSFVDASWEQTLAGNASAIQLLNPIASQMNVMRSSLMASLLHVAKFNLDRKASRIKVFETGRVFKRDIAVKDSLQTVAGIHQPMHVAGLAYGPLQPLGWNSDTTSVGFFDVKTDVCNLLQGLESVFHAGEHPALHPGRCARIEHHGQTIGWLGELHPQWRQQWGFAQAPVLFELTLDALLEHPVPRSQAVSRLHPVERDLAIVVKEAVPHDALMQCIHSTMCDGVFHHAVLFDVYRPQKPDATVAAGEKSMAVRLYLQSKDENTMTESQIETVIQAIVEQLTGQLQARLRT
jgi:phenylalanyl-tRNA synthetase beta chain